jgi:Tol biopolymer transport system component
MRTWRNKQIMVVAGLALVSVAVKGVRADFFCSTPTKVPNVNVAPSTLAGSISADGLEMYVSVEGGKYDNGYGGMFDMYVATRASTQDDWSGPVNLGPTLNGSTWEYTANISPDGLSLYFSSDRPGGSGGLDLWVATRPAKGSPWGKPVNLGPTVNSSAWDLSPRESADGLTLLFHSQRAGGYGGEDIWMSTRATKNDPWTAPVNLGPVVNNGANDGEAVLTPDGLTLFFNSDRPGGSGGYDLWVTTKPSIHDAWRTPRNLGPSVNSRATEWCSSISSDGSTLYFASDRPMEWGSCSIYQTTITPVVDFNGDGKVDETEVQLLLENWGRHEPLCDIGPTALGDGVVDMQDLAMLTRYASQKLIDPTLVACWEFDETEGINVCNSADTYSANLVGSPIWRPQGGAVGGAIELDGVDDCVVVAFEGGDIVKGPLSVFAWVKGGKPGQVIFSQQSAANWLVASVPAGALGTELRGPVRGGGPLSSQAVITDGQWHRVGLVWDGKRRALYVDGACVAEDVHENLKILYANLTIGAGKDLTPGTFWSGLIDDVRIYNRVVKP